MMNVSLIERAFEFLSDHYQSQQTFTKNEFQACCGWDDDTFELVFDQSLNLLLIHSDSDLFQVSEVFRRYASIKRFRDFFWKKSPDYLDYSGIFYDNVIVFEFFMPLRNEAVLKSTLDALFFKDTIMNRLNAIPIETLNVEFPILPDETSDAYFQRICEWVSLKFTGYSIGQYNGRFKGGQLKSFIEAAQLEQRASAYIEDETTAIVKFIFPCGIPQIKVNYATLDNPISLEDQISENDPNATESVQTDARLIRFFFTLLFVKSILQVVSGEHSIWMLESGLRTRLHIWKVLDPIE